MKDLQKKLHIGTIAGIAVTAYIGFYLISTVLKNYELKQQIDTLQQEVSTLNAERDTLKYKIQYYQTDLYKEKEARAKLGLQQPGESVVILPKDKEAELKVEEEKSERPAKSNFEQWIDFLAGRT